MRQRAEDEFRVTKRSVVVATIGQLPATDARGRAALLVRGGERQREGRVLLDQCTELAPSVSAGAEHTDWNLVHA